MSRSSFTKDTFTPGSEAIECPRCGHVVGRFVDYCPECDRELRHTKGVAVCDAVQHLTGTYASRFRYLQEMGGC